MKKGRVGGKKAGREEGRGKEGRREWERTKAVRGVSGPMFGFVAY
jgi:hypothetical protein